MWKILKYGMMVIQDREPDISLALECFIAVYWIQKIHHVLCGIFRIDCGKVNLVIKKLDMT